MKLKKALALMLILWLVMPNLTGLAETEPAAVTEAEADPADLAEEGKETTDGAEAGEETTDGAEAGDPDAEITADPAQDEVPEADEMSLGDADAADTADDAESPVGTPHGASEDAEATDAANAVTAGEEAPDAPPFEQSAVLDGVRITVRSEPGAFPAGDELQPAAGCVVSVSFEMAEVADENLETNVYHIADDMTAERLDVTAEDATTAVVETEGFSIYAVEFTYNTLQYVLEGGASAPLAEITTEVGLQGEPTPVCISDESLFCAAYEDGAWVIYSLRPFQTEEWMQVEIGGTTFTIAVTDSSDPVAKIGEEQYNTLEAAIGAAKVGDTVTLLEDVTLSRPLEIANDNTLTLDLNGHTINRALTAPTAGGNVITVEGALTLTDGKGGGTITGGNNAHDGGGVVVDGGELVMNGGNITGNRTGFCGGGVFVSNVGAFTLSGGAISGNTAVASGGGVYLSAARADMAGGVIENNTVSDDSGGSVYVEDEATFALSSAPVIDGNTRDGSAPAGAANDCTVTGLKKGTAYKAYVMAWRMENGQKAYIGSASPTVHAIAGGLNARYCNAKGVRVRSKVLSVKVGRRKKLRASVKGSVKGKKVLRHARKLRYFSSDTGVAVVDGKGRVKGVAPGTCTIYAVANNGASAAVTVNVTGGSAGTAKRGK